MIAERFPHLLALSEAEKLQLAQELYSSVFVGKTRLTEDEVLAELERSMTEYRERPESASTWEQVKARVLAPKDA